MWILFEVELRSNMNAIADKSLNSCKTNLRFILQLVLISALLVKPLQTWAIEDDGSVAESNSSSSDTIPPQQSPSIQTGTPASMNKFLGPNAAEPTGPYNRSYQEADPYEHFISVANSLEESCEHMIVTFQNSLLTTLEKLVLYFDYYKSAKYDQDSYTASLQILDDRVKSQISPYHNKITPTCAQAFALKNTLLSQIKKEKTETEFNEIIKAVTYDDLNQSSPNSHQNNYESQLAFDRLRKKVSYGHSIFNLTLQIEKNCQIIKSTPRPFLHFNPVTGDLYQSRKVLSFGDIISEAMKQDNKDEFSFKNNLDEQIDLLNEKLERIELVEHNHNEMDLKKEILQAIDRAKKTCEYKPKEKNSVKKNKTANPIEVSPTSAPITAAQEKQLLDDAIHFILTPATDWYSNEVTTVEHINNEMKAAKYLIQKKEQYSSTILQLSQNPTDNNKNNSTSNNKASASNYKTKNQAVKKVAESKKSKEEKIKAYQKWVDYLDYLIQQNQATWKARCDKGFNEELCQQYPWSPGVP